MVQTVDLRNLDRHHEWRRGSACGGLGGEGEVLAVVGNDHSKNQDGENVEEEDAVECHLDCLWHHDSGVLSLANGDSYKFGPGERVQTKRKGQPVAPPKTVREPLRRNHAAPDADEFAEAAGCLVLDESTRVVPVTKACAVVAVDLSENFLSKRWQRW